MEERVTWRNGDISIEFIRNGNSLQAMATIESLSPRLYDKKFEYTFKDILFWTDDIGSDRIYQPLSYRLKFKYFVCQLMTRDGVIRPFPIYPASSEVPLVSENKPLIKRTVSVDGSCEGDYVRLTLIDIPVELTSKTYLLSHQAFFMPGMLDQMVTYANLRKNSKSHNSLKGFIGKLGYNSPAFSTKALQGINKRNK